MLTRTVLGVVVVLLLSDASRAGPGYMYFKNNGNSTATIWIDGVKQGFVKAGEVCYMPSDGFIRPDGSTQGGYDHELGVVVKYSFAAGGAGEMVIDFTTEPNVKQWLCWFSNKEDKEDKGPKPTRAEIENAAKMHDYKGGGGGERWCHHHRKRDECPECNPKRK